MTQSIWLFSLEMANSPSSPLQEALELTAKSVWNRAVIFTQAGKVIASLDDSNVPGPDQLTYVFFKLPTMLLDH